MRLLNAKSKNSGCEGVAGKRMCEILGEEPGSTSLSILKIDELWLLAYEGSATSLLRELKKEHGAIELTHLLYFLPPRTDDFQPFVVGVSTSNVLVIVVVVFGCRDEAGRPFSTSLSCLLDFGRGGELRRTPVRRF